MTLDTFLPSLHLDYLKGELSPELLGDRMALKHFVEEMLPGKSDIEALAVLNQDGTLLAMHSLNKRLNNRVIHMMAAEVALAHDLTTQLGIGSPDGHWYSCEHGWIVAFPVGDVLIMLLQGKFA